MRIECEKYFHSHIICLVSCHDFTLKFSLFVHEMQKRKEKFKKCKIERENLKTESTRSDKKTMKTHVPNIQKWIYHAEIWFIKKTLDGR